MLLEEHHEAYRADVRRCMARGADPAGAELDLPKPPTREEVHRLRKKSPEHEIANSEPLREDGSPDLVAIGIFTEELNRVDASFGAMAAALFFSPLPIGALLSEPQ